MTAGVTTPARRRVTKEIANVRALAILRAMGDVLEGARKGRSWEAFELEWFGRRLDEARASLVHARAEVRADFVESFAPSLRTLRLYDLAPKGPTEQAVALAARAMLRLLSAFVDELEAGELRAAPNEHVAAELERARPAEPKPAAPSQAPKAKRVVAPEVRARLIAVHEQGYWAAPESDPLMRKLARYRWARYVGQTRWWLTEAGRRRARELADGALR